VIRPKIGYLSADDPRDRKAWSGSHYSIYTHLQKHVGDVTILGPFRPALPMLIGKLINQISLKLFGKRYNYRHSTLMSRCYARYFSKRIEQEKPDLLLAVSAGCEMALLAHRMPLIYVCDATVHSSLNYYPALSNLTQNSKRESLQTEEKALENSDLVVFTSAWASEKALQKIQVKRSAVLPFGANLQDLPEKNEINLTEKNPVCKLLFVGVFWENKGGKIAFDCLLELLEMGLPTELIVCGCVPPDEVKHPQLTVIPFLNKNVPEERLKLQTLYQQASLFVLPTHFEAFGVVFCEASAYGVPSLATRTGGVPEVIKDGVNGFLMDPLANANDYARKIAELWSDDSKYMTLRKSSRERFEEILNWDSWALNLKQLLPIRHEK
jgi:glycosyltransferase involved in cell wall biosynthesis